MDTDNTVLVGFCFLILHYNSQMLTEKCVQSIMELDIPQTEELNTISIVIVDNASSNGTGEKLKEKYFGINNIYVIINKENVGFSAGNNIGYKFIRKHFRPRFLIATNNDVIFVDKKLLIKMVKIYNEEPFWIAGPDIYIKDWGKHQNPELIVDGYPTRRQVGELKKQWMIMQQHYQNEDLFAYKLYLKETKRNNIFIRMYCKAKELARSNKDYLYRSENICLQGACLFFDKRYVLNNEELFRPLTFLYCEEEILRLDCYLNKWNMVYLPELLVEHFNSGSLSMDGIGFRDFCTKKEKQMDILCNSADIYLEYLRKRMK